MKMNKAQKEVYNKMVKSGPGRVSKLSGGNQTMRGDGNGVNLLTGFAKTNKEMDADQSPNTQSNKRAGSFVPKTGSTSPKGIEKQSLYKGKNAKHANVSNVGKVTKHSVPVGPKSVKNGNKSKY